MPIEPDDSERDEVGEPQFFVDPLPKASPIPDAFGARVPDHLFDPPMATGRPPRRAAPRRRPAVSSEAAPGHHALYRLFDKAGVLLYIGETNNPVERYIEHRDTKEWWPEVASHSIEWSTKGRAVVQEMEKAAIRDEWPLHNVAHQPRGDGTFWVPSYVVEKILGAIDGAVREVFGEASNDQVESVADLVNGAFKPRGNEDWGEIGFTPSVGPRVEALDLDAVISAMGSFRPGIANSMRDPKPRRRPRNERPHAKRQVGVAADPLDAADAA